MSRLSHDSSGHWAVRVVGGGVRPTSENPCRTGRQGWRKNDLDRPGAVRRRPGLRGAVARGRSAYGG
jgi:hypothetical protein